MSPRELERQISGLAELDEPVRRTLYFHVAAQQTEVSRDDAARAVGISRALAGFHLDRLADQGLLETSFRRLSGRSGPGAGRPAKLYRRSQRQFEISLPQRSYELAANILATAVDTSNAPETRQALNHAARSIGQRLGAASQSGSAKRPGSKRLMEATVATLASNGYEPVRHGSELRLHNCPFHGLVNDHKELVCGMNLALMEGIIEGLDVPGVEPVLDPQPGMCCVALRLAVPKRRSTRKRRRKAG